MKKRMVTLAMAGIMATAMMGTTAMAATTLQESSATVSYVNGGIVSEGGNGNILYYITYPSNLQLSDSTNSDTHTVSIEAATGYDLGTLNVDVTVSSTNKGKLVNSTYSVPYTLQYDGGQALSQATGSVGKLSKTNASIEGTATLGDVTSISNVAKGTTFTDTLSFSFTENLQ